MGLCCEEAARIILTDKEKFVVEVPESLADNDFFKERKEVFEILQDRSVTMYERLRQLCRKYGFEFRFSNKELYDFYMSLERLEVSWESELKKLKEAEDREKFKTLCEFAQINKICFFILEVSNAT